MSQATTDPEAPVGAAMPWLRIVATMADHAADRIRTELLARIETLEGQMQVGCLACPHRLSRPTEGFRDAVARTAPAADYDRMLVRLENGDVEFADLAEECNLSPQDLAAKLVLHRERRNHRLMRLA